MPLQEKNKGTGFYKRFAAMQKEANNTMNECGETLDLMEEVIILNRKVGTDHSKPSKVVTERTVRHARCCCRRLVVD